MDDKGSRRRKSEGYERRHKQVKGYGRTVWKFLTTHRRILSTSILLLLIVVLLFGVSGQLQAPSANSVPNGVTAIDYSTFVKQVEAGNVIAVTMQGNEINGLLTHPLSQANTPTVQATNAAMGNKSNPYQQDYVAWTRYVNVNSPTWSNPAAAPPISVDRIIYTHEPSGGDMQLSSLLLSKHVIVNTLPITGTSGWIALIGRFAPMILLVVFLLIFLSSRNGSTRSSRPLDDRVTQMGKSKVRRFERAKEAGILQPRSDKPSNATTPATSIAKPITPRVSLDPPVTFADVAGIDEVRTELEEIVQFLRSPERFNRLGAHIPRGALLVGPPGTGKTLLAKAVAGEANVPFFSMSASEFVEMFVGVGASRVRDLFNQARQAAPCVVFIDELDAVGRKRSVRVSGNDERDQTLNQLLVEMDGFNERQAVVVLAATNRVDILDKALLRPGRFDRRITVAMPDRKGRQAILKVHTRKTPLHEEVSLERLARMTVGMSGADLANLVNEAALSAARKNMDRITHDCFEDALARVQLGALRPIVMSEKERRIIAYHEGGHALVAYHLPEADTVNRVTILPRGQSLGVTQFTAEEDRYNYSRETLMARIAVGLGGRAAEELAFGLERVTTGAENDLQVVTDLARRMVTRWGMSEQVGVVFADYRADGSDMSLNMRRAQPDDVPIQSRTLVVDADGHLQLNGALPARQYSFAMAAPAPHSTNGVSMNALIDAEVQRILSEGREMARTLLSEHHDQLVRLAEALMEHEQLNRAQFEELMQRE
ncbi:MAG TPA: ATP-dependent zinc metalloprotease FtsH [Ktedonobacteraceae bacterium]|nr:ATP-dependent zinc metalloprotease FtsH [Ktedonobacteraceae bacterium]